MQIERTNIRDYFYFSFPFHYLCALLSIAKLPTLKQHMSQHTNFIQPVEKEMEVFSELYAEALRGHSPDFQSMIDYLSASGGKKIRPALLLLTAKTLGHIDQKAIDYALIMELLHTATIIHDDVIDETKIRRNRSSLNGRYDNKAAVLLGDYILSIAIVKTVLASNLQVLGIISNLALNLTEGELIQWSNSNRSIIDESYYFDIIRKKTAVLISSCTEIGALAAGADTETIEKFRLMGEYIGICFQIKDDIFDYFDPGEIGKPTQGNDIREGKITLPLIYAINNAPADQAALAQEIIKNKDFNPENIEYLIDFAKQNHGIEYAESVMQATKEKAIALLADVQDSEAKSALLGLIDYIITRNK